MQIYWNKRKRFLKKKKSLTPTASFWKPQHGRRFIVLEHDTYMAAVTSCETLYCFRALSKSQNWPSRPVGSLRNQPSFCDATTGFPAKWRLRNSVLLTRQLPDLGCASDWSCRVGNFASTTQIWVVTRHQYGSCTLVPQTSFCGETSGGIAKCRLFSQAVK